MRILINGRWTAAVVARTRSWRLKLHPNSDTQTILAEATKRVDTCSADALTPQHLDLLCHCHCHCHCHAMQLFYSFTRNWGLVSQVGLNSSHLRLQAVFGEKLQLLIRVRMHPPRSGELGHSPISTTAKLVLHYHGYQRRKKSHH